MEDVLLNNRFRMDVYVLVGLALWASALSLVWVILGFFVHKFVLGLLTKPPYGTLAAILGMPMFIVTVSTAWAFMLSSMGVWLHMGPVMEVVKVEE